MSAPSVNGSFPAISADLGISDNQSVEKIYRIRSYNKTADYQFIPMHADVFLRPDSNTANLDNMDASTGLANNAVTVHPLHDATYFAFTPTMLNELLHKLSMEAWLSKGKKKFNPEIAYKEFKYGGINMTPPPAEARDAKTMEKTRSLVLHMRSAQIREGHWPDARGGDFLSFVFKWVDCSEVKFFRVSANDVRPATHASAAMGGVKSMERCVQLVAIRSKERFLSLEALCLVPGEVDEDKKYEGRGVHVPVGIMTHNPYTAYVREDLKYATEGVPCNDSLASSEQHVQALTFVV